MHSVGPFIISLFDFKKPVWSRAGLFWPIRIWSLMDLANNYIVHHRSLAWKGVHTFHTLHILQQTSFSGTDLLTWYCRTAQMVIVHQNWFCRMSVHEKVKEKYVSMKSREACVGQVLALNRPEPDTLFKQVPPFFFFEWCATGLLYCSWINEWNGRELSHLCHTIGKTVSHFALIQK